VAPERFGNYLVHERLGAGGMATVHRATLTGHAGFEKVVALKRLLPHLAHDESFVRAFVREARIAAQLRHANVAQTYDLGLVGESYYIAMELIEGHDLRQVLKQAAGASGPMPPALVLNLLSQVCEALDYAHGLTDESGQPLGIVHRDVSPANIIVSEDGTAKLIDFGIARATSSSLMTMSGQLKGKFAYIAPETMAGNFDGRADLFSLGIVAHELLTAQPLLTGTDEIDTLRRVREHVIPPPSSVVPGIPDEVDSIVMTALARDPAERWQSAAAMRGALGVVSSRPALRATSADVGRWIQWAFEAFEVRPSARRPAVTNPGDRRRAHDTETDASGLSAGGEPDSAEISMVVERAETTTDSGVSALDSGRPERAARHQEDPGAELLGAAPASSETLEMLVGATGDDLPALITSFDDRPSGAMRGGRRPDNIGATIDLRPVSQDDLDARTTGQIAVFTGRADPASELATTGQHRAFERGREPVTLVEVADANILAEIAVVPGSKPTLMLGPPEDRPAPLPGTPARGGRATGPSVTARSSAVPIPSPTAPPPLSSQPPFPSPLGSHPPPGRATGGRNDATNQPTLVATGTPRAVDAARSPGAAPYVQLGPEYNAAAASYAESIMTPPPGSISDAIRSELGPDGIRGSERLSAQQVAERRSAQLAAAAQAAAEADSPPPRRSVIPLLILCALLAAGVAAAGYFT